MPYLWSIYGASLLELWSSYPNDPSLTRPEITIARVFVLNTLYLILFPFVPGLFQDCSRKPPENRIFRKPCVRKVGEKWEETNNLSFNKVFTTFKMSSRKCFI